VTRFVVDPGVVIRLGTERRQPAGEHELLAPTLLRSQVLSLLHEAVARGDLDEEGAQEGLEAIGRMKIRLLGDAVLRRNAWRIADEMGWSDTYTAEYVALTVLQGDALVTLDATLAKSLRGVVETARFSALF
jgi:indolepyruvate ferredoxin oxidoreductase alpha subunit